MWKKVRGQPPRSFASGSFLCHLVGGSGKDQGNSSTEQNLQSPHFIDIKQQDRCQNFGLGTRSCVFIGRSPNTPQIRVLISRAAVRTGLSPLTENNDSLPFCSPLCFYLPRPVLLRQSKGILFYFIQTIPGKGKDYDQNIL